MRSLAEIVSLRTPACDRVAEVLPAIAAGESGMAGDSAGVAGVVRGGTAPVAGNGVADEHVAGCLRCQAELSAYRRLLGHLKAMRSDEVVPPEGALTELLRALAEQRPPASTWAVRAAYVGGITVATAAAGAAGVLVWMSRRRLAPAS